MIPFTGPRGLIPLRWLPALLAVAAALAAPRPANASLVITIQSVTAVAGSTGNGLDITLTNTGPGSVVIGGHDFLISTVNANITFTQADVFTTTASYIY